MNLLKKITVDGQIRFGYAHLKAAYTFENEYHGTISPRCVFPVPEGGQITGFQVLTPEGKLVRASVCPLTEVTGESGVRLTRLSPVSYCLQWDSMETGTDLRLLLELLLPLEPRGKGRRLVFPLGGDDYRAEINLYTGEDHTKVTSPSHAIVSKETETETEVSAELSSGRDFVLDMEMMSQISCGLAQGQWGESIGIYRLISEKPEMYQGAPKHRVLLLLDHTGLRDGQAQRMVKELLFRVVQALPDGMPVQAILASNPQTPVFGGFTPAGESTAQALFYALADCGAGGDVCALLEHPLITPETLVLLISGGMPEGLSRILRGRKPPVGVQLFTLGKDLHTPLAEYWQRAEYGLHTHFYPEDLTEERVEKAVSRVLCCGTTVQVTPADGTAQELLLLGGDIAADGYLELAVCTAGQLPRGFTLWQDGIAKETLWLNQLQTYEYFPMAAQMYAAEKLKHLEYLTRRTDAGSIMAIKKQMEELSLRYGVLSSETMLQVSTADGQETGIPVQVCLSGGQMTGRRTIFGEKGGHVYGLEEKKELFEACLETLRKNIRGNGAIYSAEVLSEKERVEQTALAVTALCLVKEKDRALMPVIEAGEMYLKSRILAGFVGRLYENRACLPSYAGEVLAYLSTTENASCGEVATAAETLLRLSLQ
ncbi:MAG: hypothetical protein U0L92_07460 [Clostridia bacterium]|nr:hypothetical protein [Clostridia bacterium]